MPVCQSVQGARALQRLAECLRQRQGALIIFACFGIVASGPEEAKVEQRSPLGCGIFALVRQRQRNLQIAPRVLEIAECLIGAGARLIDGWRHWYAEAMRGGDRLGELIERGVWSVERQRAFACPARVFKRARPFARLAGVVR